MAKAEATVEELVVMIERGVLRLPEMQRRYVWRSTRVRDLLDSLYRGYPSGAILLWETDEAVPLQEMAVPQEMNPYQSTRLLLDGQQRLTSLSAVIRGESVKVRGRRKPIELLFNLEHPDHLAVVTEVDEDGSDNEDDDELTDDEADSSEDELQKRFDRMTFVVATRKLEQLPQWVKVTEVFKTDSDAGFLRRAGVSNFDDPKCLRYTQRLARLRTIKKRKTVESRLVFIHWHDSRTDAPRLYDQQGKYRGKLSTNPYDPESTSNPYGRYGSPFSPDSIKNPYSPSSPTNPYGRGLLIQGR